MLTATAHCHLRQPGARIFETPDDPSATDGGASRLHRLGDHLDAPLGALREIRDLLVAAALARLAARAHERDHHLELGPGHEGGRLAVHEQGAEDTVEEVVGAAWMRVGRVSEQVSQRVSQRVSQQERSFFNVRVLRKTNTGR